MTIQSPMPTAKNIKIGDVYHMPRNIFVRIDRINKYSFSGVCWKEEVHPFWKNIYPNKSAEEPRSWNADEFASWVDCKLFEKVDYPSFVQEA